jgi:hypothetical protein
MMCLGTWCLGTLKKASVTGRAWPQVTFQVSCLLCITASDMGWSFVDNNDSFISTFVLKTSVWQSSQEEAALYLDYW